MDDTGTTPGLTLADMLPHGTPIEDGDAGVPVRDDDVTLVAVDDTPAEAAPMPDADPVGDDEELPALVTGEVVAATEGPTLDNLTPPMRAAAAADAGGATRRTIAQIAGVSESSIRLWRQMPEYLAEVDRVKGSADNALAPYVADMNRHLIGATREAIDTLRRGLRAVDSHGHASWTTRLRAAEKLLEHGIAVGQGDTQSGNKPGGAVSANGAVVLVIKD